MGRIADSALNAGGKVHGIIPAAVSQPRHAYFSPSSDTKVLLAPYGQFLSAEAPDRSANTQPNEVETVVGSMHERKKLSKPGVRPDCSLQTLLTLIFRSIVADLSDAFIGLPGGYGTLEVRFSPLI